jgi:hypothetical protein
MTLKKKEFFFGKKPRETIVSLLLNPHTPS